MALSRDKLKALIRLANNNPSEHEANLAARKVCQQLTEGFLDEVGPKRTAYGKMNEGVLKEWVDPRTGDLNIKITQLDLHNSENNKIVEILKQLKAEITRPRTWNDVKRSTEPGFRSQYYGYSSSNTDPFDGMFRDMYERMKRDTEERKRNEEKKEKHASNYGFQGGQRDGKSDPFGSVNWRGFDWNSAPRQHVEDENYAWEFDVATGTRKRIKKQEMRKCAKCGLEIMTYRLKENPWICNPCHWKDKL